MIPLEKAYFCVNCEHIVKYEKGEKVCPVCGSVVIFPLSKWLNREDNKEERYKRENKGGIKLDFSWTEYFLLLARVIASRSKCVKRNVGCVIVKDRRILATGYVGGFEGEIDCSRKGYCIYRKEFNGDVKYCKAIHAEMNALLQCAKLGISLEGAEMYCTLEPCSNCLVHIIQAGIKTVYYEKLYNDTSRETEDVRKYILKRKKESGKGDFKLIHYPLKPEVLKMAQLIFTPDFLQKIKTE